MQRQYAAFNNEKKKYYGIFSQNINPCIYWVNFVVVLAITQSCYFIWKFVLEVCMLLLSLSLYIYKINLPHFLISQMDLVYLPGISFIYIVH